MVQQRRLLTGLMLGLLFASGCGGGGEGAEARVSVYKVTGKITLAGGPVAGASVTFSPKDKQPVATGKTGNDGTFTLTTYDPGDGAAAGNYVVVVSKPIASASAGNAPPTGHDPNNKTGGFDAAAYHNAQRAAGSTGSDSGLPEKYSKADKSDLQVEVKSSGENKFDLDLKP